MSSPDHWNLCLTEGPGLFTRDPTAWLDAQHCAVTGVKRLADVSFPCWTQPGEGVFLSNSSILKLSNSNMLVPFLTLHSPSKQMRQYMLLPIWKLHRPAKWRADSYSCSDKLAVLPDHLHTDNFHELLHHWNPTYTCFKHHCIRFIALWLPCSMSIANCSYQWLWNQQIQCPHTFPTTFPFQR